MTATSGQANTSWASSYAIFAMLALVGVVVATGCLMSSGSEAAKSWQFAAARRPVGLRRGARRRRRLGIPFWHRENITPSMITGRKEGTALLTPFARAGCLAVLAFAAMERFGRWAVFATMMTPRSQTKLLLLQHCDSARRGRTSSAAA